MMRIVYFLAGLVLSGVAASNPAHAAAWVQEKGGVYLRAGLAEEDFSGFTAVRRDLYAEYGLTDRWTVAAKYEEQDFVASNIFDRTGARVTLRRQLYKQGDWSVAAEGGYLEGEAIGGLAGCSSPGFEARIGAGRGRVLANNTGFAALDLGVRSHENGCARARLETVLGYTDWDGWTYTAQVWLERGQGTRSDKVELLVSRLVGPVELAAGYRVEVSGAFEERATVLAIALRL